MALLTIRCAGNLMSHRLTISRVLTEYSQQICYQHTDANGPVQDNAVSTDPSNPAAPSILTPLDEQKAKDTYVTTLGDVYDRERVARDVSRMFPHKRLLMDHAERMPLQQFDFQKTKGYLRELYARFGKNSGIDPGVMWPTREEIGYRTDAERDLGIPTLQESWARVQEKRNDVMERDRAHYETVDANMAKMGAEIKAFRKRQQQAEDAINAEKSKREKLMDEAKELLGYKVDPRDKRFQELLETKEAEIKKQAKLTKKKEKEAKAQARLTTVDASPS